MYKSNLSLLWPDGNRDVVASSVDDELVPLAVHDGGVGDDLHGAGTEIQSDLNPGNINNFFHMIFLWLNVRLLSVKNVHFGKAQQFETILKVHFCLLCLSFPFKTVFLYIW